MITQIRRVFMNARLHFWKDHVIDACGILGTGSATHVSGTLCHPCRGPLIYSRKRASLFGGDEQRARAPVAVEMPECQCRRTGSGRLPGLFHPNPWWLRP